MSCFICCPSSSVQELRNFPDWSPSASGTYLSAAEGRGDIFPGAVFQTARASFVSAPLTESLGLNGLLPDLMPVFVPVFVSSLLRAACPFLMTAGARAASSPDGRPAFATSSKQSLSWARRPAEGLVSTPSAAVQVSQASELLKPVQLGGCCSHLQTCPCGRASLQPQRGQQSRAVEGRRPQGADGSGNLGLFGSHGHEEQKHLD